jgi:hypothetical protein
MNCISGDCECIEQKIKAGSSLDVVFHILKGGSGQPYEVSTYSIEAWYKDIFGHIISSYAYPTDGHKKPVSVEGNMVRVPLTASETRRTGRYDIYIKITVDEHVCIKAKRTVEICGDDCDCCCSEDVHFDILLCNILYTDGATYVPHVEGGWLSFIINGTPPPEPVQLIPVFTVVDGYLYINGVNTGFEIVNVKGDKGDKGDDGKIIFWQVLSFPPEIGDTVKVNGIMHVVTANDLPLASGTFVATVGSL